MAAGRDMTARVRVTLDVPFSSGVDPEETDAAKVDKQRRQAGKDSQKVAADLAKRLGGSLAVVDVLVEEVRES